MKITLPERYDYCSRTELKLAGPVPGLSLNPIRHISALEALLTAISDIEDMNPIEEIHTIGYNQARYYGFIRIKDARLSDNIDIDWVVGICNKNDGTGATELHSGMHITPYGGVVMISSYNQIVQRKGLRLLDDLQPLVNENLALALDCFSVQLDRMEAYKEIKIDNPKAHDIIGRLMKEKILSGRVAAVGIDEWHKPTSDYIKPRTIWSLFCLCGFLHSRLKGYEMIERNVLLHQFFDSVAKFNKKTTTWIQSRFA